MIIDISDSSVCKSSWFTNS